TALGVAGVSIAAVAMLVALTGTAALLGFARKRIRPSRRAHAPAARHPPHAGARGFFAGAPPVVQRRPLGTAAGPAPVLLAAAARRVGTRGGLDNIAGLPQSLSSFRVDNDLTSRYGRPSDPAITVVARTDAGSLDKWAAQWSHARNVVDVPPATEVA